MHGIHKLSSIVIITLILSSAANALQCLSCKDMPSPEDCRVVTTCSSNSQCYTEQFVSSGGIILYNTGCLPRSLCHTKRSLTDKRLMKRQETGSVTDIVTCIQCCTDNFCNIEGCGKIALRQPQRPPLCFSCTNHLVPNSCRDVTMCDANHMCALTETTTFGSRHWKSECIPTLQCEVMKKQGLLFSHDLCYTCCQDDFCNNNCNERTSTPTSALYTSAVTKLPSTAMIVIPTNHTQNLQTTTLSTTLPSTVLTKTSSSVSSTSTETSTLVTTTGVKRMPTAVTTSSFTSNFSYTSLPSSSKPPNVIQMSTAKYSTLENSLTSLKLESVSTTSAKTSTLSSVAAAKTTSQVTTKNTTSYLSTVNTVHVSNTTNGCEKKTFDICFVVDSSGSLGRTGFEKELHFISEVVKTISYQSNAANHFCVVTFSTHAHPEIKLNEFQNVDQVLNALGTISFRTGETNTHHGLNNAQHQLIHDGRPGADQDLILITDGQFNEPALTYSKATQIKRNGIKIFVVGIGSQTNSSELERIATDKSHFFQIHNIHHLKTQYIDIVQILCKGIAPFL